MKIKYQKWAIAMLIISALLVILLFVFTDPREVGLFGILTVIIAIYAFFVAGFYLLSKVFRRKPNHSERRAIYISATLAFAPVLLIILNSLGAVGIIELVLIMIFEVVAIFLITKRAQ